MTTADMNGDCAADVITVITGTTSNGTVSLGDGSGTFTPGAPTLDTAGFDHVITVDVNGDGFPDLAVTNGSTLRIIQNTTGGTCGLPTGITDPATNVTATTATLNARVNPHGLPTGSIIQYGPGQTYGSQVPAAPLFDADGSGTTYIATPHTITGLTPNTTYHFRAVVKSSAGTVNGADQVFTTTGGGSGLTTIVDTGGLLRLATFTDSQPANQSQYAAAIDWGDGEASSGVVVRGGTPQPGGNSSTFFVSGAHIYLTTGTYTITISVTKAGQPFVTPIVTIVVQPTHYRVELKAWIPFPVVVDPEQPVPLPYVRPPRLESDCYRPSVFAQFLTVVQSRYVGDNHMGYDGSYRAAAAVEFDWDGRRIFNFVGPSFADTGSGDDDGVVSAEHLPGGGDPFGTTHRQSDYVNGGTGTVTSCREAKTVDHAVRGQQNGGTGFGLNIASPDPLVAVAPDIDSAASGTMAPNGTLTLSYQTDLFPSHGIRVTRDGVIEATDIVSDASCLAQGDVLGLAGLPRLTAGLTHPNDIGSLIVPPGGGSQTLATQSQLCTSGFWGVIVAFDGSTAFLASSSSSSRGSVTNRRPLTLRQAERVGLVAVQRFAGGLMLVMKQPQPVRLELMGKRLTFKVLKIDGRHTRATRYYGPATGHLVLDTHARRLVLTQKGKALRTRQPDNRPPQTRASVRIFGNTAVVRFRATDTTGVRATYVSYGNRRGSRVQRGMLRIPRTQLGSLSFFSVDVFGNVERPKRLHSTPTGPH